METWEYHLVQWCQSVTHKRGWDDRWEFSNGRKRMVYQRTLLDLVDEDTNSFNKIMDREFKIRMINKKSELIQSSKMLFSLL